MNATTLQSRMFELAQSVSRRAWPLPLALAVVALLIGAGKSVAQTQWLPESPGEIKKLSLKELLNIEVTTVSRKETTVGQSPAAIFVITQEMIRRSGATTIPELFRMVPGMDVARIDSHRWAVSIRGFNQEFANKLLVLSDGRAVYTPLTSGVFWEMQDTVLEDIERIEVVRGPSAALWGANAVNGVINIISKSAKDTQGLLVSGGYGSENPGFGSVRYGGKLAEDVFYRVYAKGLSLGDTKFPDGTSAQDAWHQQRGGLRIDWGQEGDNRFTVQGDVAYGEPQELYIPAGATNPVSGKLPFFGANLLGRWTHTLGVDSDFTVQAYYDHIDRDGPTASFLSDTFDLDFQYRFPWGNRHAITWGLGYRYTTDNVMFQPPVFFEPQHRDLHLATAFVQDEIQLVKDRLALTLGSQFQYYSFTGLDWQPTVRLKWTPTPRQTVWAAVSRALRTPSRADNDGLVQTSFTTRLANRDLHPEEVMAYEVGYRAQVHERLTLDLTAFYNEYDRLRSAETIFAGFPSVTKRDEKIFGETYGAEVSAIWEAVDWWRWQATYSFLEVQLHRDAGGNDAAGEQRDEGRNPHHQVTLSSSMNLTRAVDLDCSLRFVDQLQSPPGFSNIPGYFELDVRLAWRPRPNLELSIVGQNLLEDRHPEFLPGSFGALGQPREMERAVYGKVTWHF